MFDRDDIIKYVRETYSNKKLLKESGFQKSLQDVADSGLKMYGFKPVPLRVEWGDPDGSVAYISDKDCYINMNGPDKQGLSFVERKRVAVGDLAHEVFGHGLFTDFSFMNNLHDENTPFKFLKKYFKKAKVAKETINSLETWYEKAQEAVVNIFFELLNTIEDPVIEYLCTTKYPGFQHYLDYSNFYLQKVIAEAIDGSKLDEYPMKAQSFLAQMRDCCPDDVRNIVTELDKTQIIRDNVTNMPNFEDRIVATAYVFGIFYKDIEKLLKNIEENPKQYPQYTEGGEPKRTKNGQDNQKSRSRSNSEKGNEQKSGSSTSPEKDDKSEDESQSKTQSENKGDEGLSFDGNSSQNASQTSDNNTKSAKNDEGNITNDRNDTQSNDNDQKSKNDKCDPKAQAEFEENLKNAEREAAKTKSDIAKEMASQTKEDDDIVSSAQKWVYNLGDDPSHTGVSIDFIDIPNQYNSVERYNAIYTTEYKRIAKQLARLIQSEIKQKRSYRAMYELDEGSMLDVEAYSRGSDKTFMDYSIPHKHAVAAVSIMVDLSGSMYGYRIEKCLPVLMLLEDFCRQAKIPCEIFGHQVASDVVIRKFITFGEKAAINTASRLVSVPECVGGCNRDGFAIRYGLARLKKRPENAKMLFILSDGQPNDGTYGTSAMKKEMPDIYKTARKYNTTIIPIAIGDDYDKLKGIYGANLVDGRNLNLLPKQIVNKAFKNIKKLI